MSRLIVRVGPQSPLAEICRDAIAVAQDIKFELMGIGNSVDLKKDQSEIFRELQPVEEEMSKLKLLRPSTTPSLLRPLVSISSPPEP